MAETFEQARERITADWKRRWADAEAAKNYDALARLDREYEMLGEYARVAVEDQEQEGPA